MFHELEKHLNTLEVKFVGSACTMYICYFVTRSDDMRYDPEHE